MNKGVYIEEYLWYDYARRIPWEHLTYCQHAARALCR